jgi:hypothetical protein
MKHVALSFIVLLATLAFAQQQGQPPPATSPPYQTPPTFPQGRATPRQQLPPDTEAPPSKSMSAPDVERQITRRLSSEPSLSGTNLDAKVDERSVVLTGIVDSEKQHQLALGIAQSYAGQRKIVDKIKLRQHT